MGRDNKIAPVNAKTEGTMWNSISQKGVDNDIRQYWRSKHEEFKDGLKMLHSTRFYDALGYELAIPSNIDRSALQGFTSSLEVFCWRLRTFDQLEGTLTYSDPDNPMRMHHVPHHESHGNLTKAEKKRAERVRKMSMTSQSKVSNSKRGSLWPPSVEEVCGLLQLDNHNFDDVRDILHSYGPRELHSSWEDLIDALLQTWPYGQTKPTCLSEYILAVEEFIFDESGQTPIRGHKNSLAVIAAGYSQDGSMEFPSLDQSHNGTPMPVQLALHVAILCRVFNFGGLLKLAVAARMPSICQEILQLFQVYKLLCSCFHSTRLYWVLLKSFLRFHEGKRSNALQNFLVTTSTKKTTMARFRGHVAGMQRRGCTNCRDPILQQTIACEGCLGPRCTDEGLRVLNYSAMDWDIHTMKKMDDLNFYDERFGWIWPAHPVHGRWLDGRNTLLLATQHGNDDIIGIILGQCPDVLSTTFGGDTVLHLSARYDQELALFKMLVYSLKEIEVCDFDSNSGRLSNTRNTAPLEDLRQVLKRTEMQSNPRNPGSPACPCRGVKVTNVWKQEESYNIEQVKYIACHGESGITNSALPRKPRPSLESEESENLLAGTLSTVTEFPTLLRQYASEQSEGYSGFEKRTNMLQAIALFRDMRNEMGRTALHVAAAMDRDTCAKALLALGSDPGVRDRFQHSALQAMVKNIPQNASQALDQFMSIDRSSRQEYFYLMEIERLEPSDSKSQFAKLLTPEINHLHPLPRTLLQDIVHQDRKNLVIHPVVQQMIAIRWDLFGFYYHLWEIVKYCVFLGLWLAAALMGRINGSGNAVDRNDYTTERVVVESLASAMLIYYVVQEVMEYRLAEKSDRYHMAIEAAMLRDPKIGERSVSNLTPTDFQNLYRGFFKRSNEQGSYFADLSNWVDITFLVCLPASEIIQIVSAEIKQRQGSVPEWPSIVSSWFLSVGLLAAFMNLMKFTRAFNMFGTFLATMGRIGADTIRFSVLFITVLIPFAAIFGLFFGGDLEGYETFGWCLFVVFKLAMVDQDSPVGSTGAVLYVVWVFLSAVIFLNLFIAMMSASFQEIYDTSKKVAAMEKALVVAKLEEKLYNGSWRPSETVFNPKVQLDYYFETVSPELLQYILREYNDPDEDELDTIGSVRTKLMIAISRLSESNEELKADLVVDSRKTRDEMQKANKKFNQELKNLKAEIQKLKER
eukprot:m.28059 g.28059  ORF g.28059 m.28059 type:complete len:1197 (-) comp7969_c0_seq1:1265-4855(-)